MSDIRISWLGIYPIKSCAAATIDGQDIKQAFADLRGLTVGRVADRGFMVVDGNYKFLTQREISKLATVSAELLRGADGVIDRTQISAPGLGSFVLDPRDVSGTRIIAEMHNKKKVGETVAVREKVPAHIMNGPGAEWFREVIGRKDVHLVYQADSDIRISDRSFATGPGKNNPVSFGDGFSILLTSTATLAKLNSALDGERPMDRFRPNIIIDGPLAPNEENTFLFAQYGAVFMNGVKPCTRCVMTGIDQKTGVLGGSEILKELGRTSRVSYVQNDTEVSGVVFGENLIPENTGPVRVDDRVVVLARKDGPQFKAA